MTLDEYIDNQIKKGNFNMGLSEAEFVKKMNSVEPCGSCCGDWWDDWNIGIKGLIFRTGKIRGASGVTFANEYKMSWKEVYQYIDNRNTEYTQIIFEGF